MLEVVRRNESHMIHALISERPHDTLDREVVRSSVPNSAPGSNVEDTLALIE